MDPSRVSEVLGGVDVVGVVVREGEPLEVVVCLKGRPRCGECGGVVWSKGKRDVRLADRTAFDHAVRLVWRKRRWRCPSSVCGAASFTEQAAWIAPQRGGGFDQPGGAVGDRAGRPLGADGG